MIEALDDFGNLKEIEEIMGRPIAWAPDLQLRGDALFTSPPGPSSTPPTHTG